MGLSGSDTEGSKIIWMTVRDRDRGDTGVPGLPDDLQHFGVHSGKGGSDGILRASGGTPQAWLGGG